VDDRLHRRNQSLLDLEVEMQAERAAALGRIGRTFEALVAELRRLRGEIDAAADGDERAALVERYRETRQKAKLWQWYVIVQREAMGLRGHELVMDAYRLPDE
jgi:hypothetical protein